MAQISPVSNVIGIDISTFPENAAFNYDSCFAKGQEAGMGSVGIFQNWTALETAPQSYDFTLLDIANYYYPLHNMPLDFTLTPIHTNNLEVPADLVSIDFDDPVFIDRFKTLLDSIKNHIPDVTLSSLIIGSEHDIYLGANSLLWTKFINFYTEVGQHARALWPGLKVASELTFNGLIFYNNYAQLLNNASDYIGVSYYPLQSNFTVKPVSIIASDFDTLVSLYPVKPICFYQYGYPSSVLCNSSDALQSQFITQTFTSWDAHASHISLIDFTWLHDLDTAIVNYYGTYYGITDPVFLEYLHSIGLRYWNGNGSDKPAFAELKCQAQQRGYNAVNCTVSSSKENRSNLNQLNTFPNPVNDWLSFEVPFDAKEFWWGIYDHTGKIVKEGYLINRKVNRVYVNELPNGVYYLKCKGEFTYSKSIFVISE